MIVINSLLVIYIFCSSLKNLYSWARISGEIDLEERLEDRVALLDAGALFISAIMGFYIWGWWVLLFLSSLLVFFKVVLLFCEPLVVGSYSCDRYGRRYFIACLLNILGSIVLLYFF